MSNENNRENMDNRQPENATILSGTKNENPSITSVPEKRQSETCDKSVCEEKLPPNTRGANPGVVIKNSESESLNSLLVYDSDSSSSSEIEKLNLNWRVQLETEESSTSSSSSSSEDEDEDSDSTSEEEEVKEVAPTLNKGAIRKSNPVLKTDGEMSLDQLPPVPDLSKLNISVEDENFVHMGHVLGIVDKLVTVAAIPNSPAYDLDTLLFLDNGKRPLGFVFDVLGQVTSPIYAIRFNAIEDIKNLQLQIGAKVYSAPTSKHTQYVFLQQLLKMKGSDASWLGDNEVPSEFADYSDDESESYQRFGIKKLGPHVKRTHSGDNHKKFENTMNRRNILNTKFNKYMDSYKQARLNKAKAKKGAPQINAVPAFDPTVPPPSHTPFYQGLQVLPPPEYSTENNNSGMSHFTPSFFMNNFVANLAQPNSAGYYTNPGPSHE